MRKLRPREFISSWHRAVKLYSRVGKHIQAAGYLNLTSTLGIGIYVHYLGDDANSLPRWALSFRVTDEDTGSQGTCLSHLVGGRKPLLQAQSYSPWSQSPWLHLRSPHCPIFTGENIVPLRGGPWGGGFATARPDLDFLLVVKRLT